MSIDGEALIETIAEREWRWYWDHNRKGREPEAVWADVAQEAAEGWRERARAITAVALPLLADAIEAAGDEDFNGRDLTEEGRCAHRSVECHAYAAHTAYRFAARLVRSLLGGNDGSGS